MKKNLNNERIFYEILDPYQVASVQSAMGENLLKLGSENTVHFSEYNKINLLRDDSLVGGLVQSIIHFSMMSAEQLIILLYLGCVNKDPTILMETDLGNSVKLNKFADYLKKKEVPFEFIEHDWLALNLSFDDFTVLSFYGRDFSHTDILKNIKTEFKSALAIDIADIAQRIRMPVQKNFVNRFKHGVRTRVCTQSYIPTQTNKDWDNVPFILSTVTNTPPETKGFGLHGASFDLDYENAFCTFCCTLSKEIVNIRRRKLLGEILIDLCLPLSEVRRFDAKFEEISIEIQY